MHMPEFIHAHQDSSFSGGDAAAVADRKAMATFVV